MTPNAVNLTVKLTGLTPVFGRRTPNPCFAKAFADATGQSVRKCLSSRNFNQVARVLGSRRCMTPATRYSQGSKGPRNNDLYDPDAKRQATRSVWSWNRSSYSCAAPKRGGSRGDVAKNEPPSSPRQRPIETPSHTPGVGCKAPDFAVFYLNFEISNFRFQIASLESAVVLPK